jgi:phage terminase large subunit GpA-like protein
MLRAQSKTRTKRYKSRRSLAEILGPYAAACGHLVEDRRYSFKISASERAVLRRRKLEKPSAWVEKNFKVPTGPFESGYLSFEITPHLFGMLDAYALPFVTKVAVCAAPQTTKTTFGHAALAWSSVFAPGPALHLMPTETAATEMLEERLQRIYKESPQLRRLLTGRKEDISKYKIRLRTMSHRAAWSGSPTSVAHRSMRYYLADETDKYQERPSDTEASTLDLVKLRTRSYKDRSKGIILSSASTEKGFIWREISTETEAVFVFWSRCPYCGTEQLMEFGPDSFWWPKGEDGHSLDRKEIDAKKLARYICSFQGCKRMWDDDARDKAQRLNMRGGWRLRTEDGSMGEEMFHYLHRVRPASIGFLVPAWISYFVSLSEVAAAYLKCKDKNLSPEEQFAAYQNFMNAYRSLPWKVELQTKPAEKILEFCDTRPEGMLPGGEQAATLLAAVDTQDNGEFYISLWAIGWGMQNEQWLVLRRKIHSFEDIAQICWGSEYYDGDGQRHTVEHVFIDMLGHRTKEVMEFCLQYEGLITPIFGSSRDMGSMGYAFSQREYLPGSAQPLPGGGIRAIRINTKYYKDNMAIKLSLAPDSPGSIHLYATVGDDYCKQLVSEARDEKGRWQQIGSRPNHYWDNWMAINCMADWLGIKHRIKPDFNQVDVEEEEIMAVQSTFM